MLRERIELSTSPLPRECSTTELPQQVANAADFCHKAVPSASADRHIPRSRTAAHAGLPHGGLASGLRRRFCTGRGLCYSSAPPDEHN